MPLKQKKSLAKHSLLFVLFSFSSHISFLSESLFSFLYPLLLSFLSLPSDIFNPLLPFPANFFPLSYFLFFIFFFSLFFYLHSFRLPLLPSFHVLFPPLFFHWPTSSDLFHFFLLSSGHFLFQVFFVFLLFFLPIFFLPIFLYFVFHNLLVTSHLLWHFF